MENHCANISSSSHFPISGFCFAGHEATISANEGSGHGKSHIWYCWRDQMMANYLQVDFGDWSESWFCCSCMKWTMLTFYCCRKLTISFRWCFAFISFAIRFVSIVTLLNTIDSMRWSIQVHLGYCCTLPFFLLICLKGEVALVVKEKSKSEYCLFDCCFFLLLSFIYVLFQWTQWSILILFCTTMK